MQLSFDDVAVYFSEEQWRNLSPDQRELYKDVMKDNYSHLLSMGFDIETPDIFNQIEEWESPSSSNTRKNAKSVVSSRTESKSPKPKATKKKKKCVEIPASVPSTPSGILSNSVAPTEHQSQKDPILGKDTIGIKKKLKFLAPKCLVCKGVYKCYCSFAKINSKKPFVCDDCGKAYSHESYLIGHQKSHYSRNPHKCSLCEKSFKKPGHLKKHQKTHNSVEYKCQKCQLVFQTNRELKEHKMAHQSEHVCTKCDEKFRSLQKLKSHEREAHSKLLECSLCHQRFRYKTLLLNHQREHVGSEVYKCHKCEKVYTRLIYLLRHAEVHSTKVQDGDLNANSPSKEADIRSPAHTSNIRPSPYQDGVTDEAEASTSVVTSHPVLKGSSRQKFLKKEIFSEELLKKFDVVRLFKCKKCKKCFRHHSTLVRHARCHSMLLVCHHCGQTFGKLVKLYLHKCRLERRRPYKCSFCEKAFSFLSLLRLHRSTHTWSYCRAKSIKSPQISSPERKMFTAPPSLLLHQTNHQVTKNPSHASCQSSHHFNISQASPNKRPCQEMVPYKDYVKRVCYRSCDSRNTM